MDKVRQFSLAYLLAEITCIALSLGFTCQAFRTSDDYPLFRAVLICAAIPAWGAAIGGLFQRMAWGCFLAAYIFILLAVLSTNRGWI